MGETIQQILAELTDAIVDSNFKSPSRRERIATALAAGILAGESPDVEYPSDAITTRAVTLADALIAALGGEDA